MNHYFKDAVDTLITIPSLKETLLTHEPIAFTFIVILELRFKSVAMRPISSWV